jgi:ubiquinol-cytochrome c reductase cytochrome b subunit
VHGREEGTVVIRAAVRFVDQRTNQTSFVNKALRYLFPDHWSFLLGEVALYCFMLLVATGVYLTLFFDDSIAQTTYHGSYAPLDGTTMSHAYLSVVHLSLDVKAGLLIRQTHHWAANVFVVAIVLHLLRVFFTGAYRKPRELTYFIGIGMLVLSLLEGYLGYSLADDLLSGMGLAIGYGVALSIPFVGANLAELIWGGPFPGSPAFWPRMYVAHILIFPVLIGLLLTAHLALVASRHHTQFKRSPRPSERRLLGLPMFPAQAPRSLGLMLAVFGVLFLLGGLVQINPIWLWGPYHVGDATNGAQPDWYLGWLIGALRLVPGWDFVIGNYTVVPNPFWGGVLFPGIVFGFIGLWPFLERRRLRDHRFHNVLDRPRDAPWRTAIGLAMLVWVFLIFMAGSADRVYVFFGLSYQLQIWLYRVLIWVIPLITLVVAKRVCEELRDGERAGALQRAAELAARAKADTASAPAP